MSTKIVHWGRTALIYALLISGSLVQAGTSPPIKPAKFDPSKYVYAAPLMVHAPDVGIRTAFTIGNAALGGGLGQLETVEQVVRLVFLFHIDGRTGLTATYRIKPGASLSLDLSTFFGEPDGLFQGMLFVESDYPIVGTVQNQHSVYVNGIQKGLPQLVGVSPFTLVRAPVR